MEEKAITVDSILDQFQTEIGKAAETIRRLIPTLEPKSTQFSKTERLGDVRTALDNAVFKHHYRPIIGRKEILTICEETHRAVNGKLSRQALSDLRFFVLLDSIDGTVNLLQGLTCGVNVAIGRIPRGGSISLGDIEGVLVADYQTLKMYRWSVDGDYQFVPPPVE